MKFLKQTKLHCESVRGNCLATCLACILDLEIEEVPQFEEIVRPRNWNVELIQWILSIGYYIHAEYPCKYTDSFGNKVIEMPEDVCIVSGDSPRGDFLHSVIYKNKELYHDPHPSNAGILNVRDYWLIYPQEGNLRGKWYGFEYEEFYNLSEK